MIFSVCSDEEGWLKRLGEAINVCGVGIVRNVVDDEFISAGRKALRNAEKAILRTVGKQVIENARKNGDNALRLLMKYDPFFYKLFEVPQLIDVLDTLLSPFAVLKFINGTLQKGGEQDQRFRQRRFHMNTRQIHPGTLTSMDLVFPFNDWSERAVTLFVCPGTQQQGDVSLDLLHQIKTPVNCHAGDLLLLDSTIWHYETANASSEDQMSVGLQFTMPYVKPHFDHVTALGNDVISALPEKTKQFMGWNSRIPSGLGEFYVPEEERLYKAGQP